MNRKLQAFQDFLAIQSIQVPMWGFIFNMFIAAVLAYLLGRIYVKYGSSFSNRKMLSNNFVLLAMTTTLVIAIIKSSLALSLGLVGALSIVRFRAAIKEPEELMYLFLVIAIGLGLGADQRLITIVATALISAAIFLKNKNRHADENHNLFLTISTAKAKSLKLDTIVDVLKKNCSLINLRRFDEQKESLEVSFLVDYSSFDQLQKSKEELQALDPNFHITFLDNKGIG